VGKVSLKLNLKWDLKLNSSFTTNWTWIPLQTRIGLKTQIETGSNSTLGANSTWTGLKLEFHYKLKLNSNSDYKPNLNWPQTRISPQIELAPQLWAPWPQTWVLLQIGIEQTSFLMLTTTSTGTDLFLEFCYKLNLNQPLSFYWFWLHSKIETNLRPDFYYKLKLNQPLFQFWLQTQSKIDSTSTLGINWTWPDLKLIQIKLTTFWIPTAQWTFSVRFFWCCPDWIWTWLFLDSWCKTELDWPLLKFRVRI